MIDSPYKDLGIPEDASQEEIKVAYKSLAKKYHPDKNPDDNVAKIAFQQVNKAYSLLSNPDKKEQYDASGNIAEPMSDEGKAENAMMQHFSQSLQKNITRIESVDLIKETINGLKCAEESQRNMIEKTEEVIDQFTKAKKRLSSKYGKRLLINIIEHEIEIAIRSKESTEENIKTLRLAQKLTAEYEFKIDELVQLHSRVTIQFGPGISFDSPFSTDT